MGFILLRLFLKGYRESLHYRTYSSLQTITVMHSNYSHSFLSPEGNFRYTQTFPVNWKFLTRRTGIFRCRWIASFFVLHADNFQRSFISRVNNLHSVMVLQIYDSSCGCTTSRGWIWGWKRTFCTGLHFHGILWSPDLLPRSLSSWTRLTFSRGNRRVINL